MANRVTDGEVREILDTDLADLTAFITTSNAYINNLLADAGFSEAYMKVIEMWLAAHFACMNDPRSIEESAGKGRSKFEGKHGMGLEHTRYGQQVMMLDTSGKLKDASTSTTTGRITVATREE